VRNATLLAAHPCGRAAPRAHRPATADEIIDKVRSITARMEQLINATEVGDVTRQTA
jgi:hypothetical protein